MEDKVIIPEFDKQEKATEETVDKTTLKGYASPEQIEAWKKEFHVDEIHEAIVDDKIAYFKKASRATLRAALSFLDKDRMKYMEVILVNCIVGGEKSMLDDDDYFLGLIEVVPDLTKGKLAKIKKY